MKANAKGAALLKKMMDDKNRLREARLKKPGTTQVDGIKFVPAVPVYTAS